MSDCEEKKNRPAVGAMLPYAKGSGWIGVAVMMFLQYQQTQTAQTKASAGAETAQAAATREAELRGAARAMYRNLSWEIGDCRRRIDEMDREHHVMIEDFNTHQHERRGRGAVSEPFRHPTDDDRVDVGPVRIRRGTLRSAASALRKPDSVRRAQGYADSFFYE